MIVIFLVKADVMAASSPWHDGVIVTSRTQLTCLGLFKALCKIVSEVYFPFSAQAIVHLTV